MLNYDLLIFRAFNNLAGQNRLLDYLGIFLAEYLAYVLVVWLVVYLFWGKKKRWQKLVAVFVAGVSALAARYIVKSLIVLAWGRPRPFVDLSSDHNLVIMQPIDNFQAFPSGHAIFFFALATALMFYNKKLGLWFLLAAALIGLARIFVGVHWPTDILAGAILGVLTAYATQALYLKYKKPVNWLLKKVFAWLL